MHLAWLDIQVDLGLTPRTIDAYARELTDYLTMCARGAVDPQGFVGITKPMKSGTSWTAAHLPHRLRAA
jgi:hypothetical protein